MAELLKTEPGSHVCSTLPEPPHAATDAHEERSGDAEEQPDQRDPRDLLELFLLWSAGEPEDSSVEDIAQIVEGTLEVLEADTAVLPVEETPTPDEEDEWDLPSFSVFLRKPLVTSPHAAQPQPSGTRRLPLLLGLLCLFLTLMLGVLAWPLLFPPPWATVTLSLGSVPITVTRTLFVVPQAQAEAHPTTDQIAGRMLAPVTERLTATVPATGIAHQQAQAARGLLTLYNALPTPQTIPAGERLVSADGIAVVTLADAALPAGTLAINGEATVPAQAEETGPQGNIGARDLYGPCCREGVLVENAPFSGGQAARTYPVVTAQDLHGAATALTTHLTEQLLATLHTQASSQETLVTPLTCTSLVSSDHQAGEEAHQVPVTVRLTCTSVAYDTRTLQEALGQALTWEASRQLGTGASLLGEMQTSVTWVQDPRDHRITLAVQASGMWAAWGSEFSLAQIKRLIAGLSKAAAMKVLAHLPGVQQVTISLAGGATTLPTDQEQIHLVLLAGVQ